MKEQHKTRYEILNDTYCHHLRAARKCQCPPLKKWNEDQAKKAMEEMHELADLLPFHPTITEALGWKKVELNEPLKLDIIRLTFRKCNYCETFFNIVSSVCPHCLIIN